jgi:S1-C subfamily serine protease
VAWVQPDDPAREGDAALGTRPAVRVNDVAADSPAAVAGVKTGDLILQVNDQTVGDPSGFAAALSDPAPKAAFKLLRGGREQTLTLDLSAEDR